MDFAHALPLAGGFRVLPTRFQFLGASDHRRKPLLAVTNQGRDLLNALVVRIATQGVIHNAHLRVRMLLARKKSFEDFGGFAMPGLLGIGETAHPFFGNCERLFDLRG